MTLPIGIPFQTEAFNGALRGAMEYVPVGGAEVTECLEAARNIRDGDNESWYAAWVNLAGQQRRNAVASLAAGRTKAARDTFLRAAQYYRVACHFLEGDPRLATMNEGSAACFETAMRLSAPACEALEIQLPGGSRTGFFFQGEEAQPQATLLVVGSEGTSVVEQYFACAAPVVQRGWNCLTVTGGAGVNTQPYLWAAFLLETVVTLPLVDPTCVAALYLEAAPSDRPLRQFLPLGIGNAHEVAWALKQGVDQPGDCFGSNPLGLFHRCLLEWLEG